MVLRGKNQSIRRQTCPSATLFTTDPTWSDLGSNLASKLTGQKVTTEAMAFGPENKLCLLLLFWQYILVMPYNNLQYCASSYCIAAVDYTTV